MLKEKLRGISFHLNL